MEILTKNLNLTGMTEYFNQHFSKRNGKKFTLWDIRAYSMTGNVPAYIGGGNLYIDPCVPEGGNVRLWQLVRDTNRQKFRR